MKSNIQVRLMVLLTACTVVSAVLVGCGSDNRVPTAAELQETDAKRLQYIEQQNMPEAAKKELESHMGGAPYQNPAIAEAMAKAKEHGAKMQPGGRQF